MFMEPVLLLATLIVGSYAEDKNYVVDGVLKIASEQLFPKTYPLSTASLTLNQDIDGLHIRSDLALSATTLQVENLVRRGDINYSKDKNEVSYFGFNAQLRARVESSFELNVGEYTVYSGVAKIRWDIGFNATLNTEGCNLKLHDKPIFTSDSFQIDLYSKNEKMEFFYKDDPFDAVTSVYLESVSVMVDDSLLKIPICEAIEC